MKFQNFINILLIGDSVDRNAVVDWCDEYRGDLYAQPLYTGCQWR